MPPRAKLPGGPGARAPRSTAGPAQASPDHVAQEPTHAPADARPYEFYMNQLSGLRVDPPAAKGSSDGAASTSGGAKSDDPFDWSRKLFPTGGNALPPNPLVTAGDPRPSSAASGGDAKPPAKPAGEVPLNTFFSIDLAGKTQGSSPGDAATTGKPKAESPLPESTGGGAKSDDPFDWSRKLFPTGGDTLPPSATPGTGAKPEARPYESPPNPFATAGTPRPSSPATGGGAKPPVKPAAELPLNTFFTTDPPPAASTATPQATPQATPGGGGPDRPEKPQVEASVTIEPAGTKPPGQPESEVDRMQKSQSEYFRQMQQMQTQTNEQQLMTAKLKQESDMVSAVANFIKQSGRGIKDLAA